jgi:hypothetical protein
VIRADQIRASLIGGSLGDAWGGPYEGRPGPLAAPFPDVGQLSDDTYLTIATCEAIADARGTVAARAIAHSFKCWFNALPVARAGVVNAKGHARSGSRCALGRGGGRVGNMPPAPGQPCKSLHLPSSWIRESTIIGCESGMW